MASATGLRNGDVVLAGKAAAHGRCRLRAGHGGRIAFLMIYAYTTGQGIVNVPCLMNDPDRATRVIDSMRSGYNHLDDSTRFG